MSNNSSFTASGWTEKKDYSSGRYYYKKNSDGTISGTIPGTQWRKYHTQKAGDYYVNEQTGEKSFKVPPAVAKTGIVSPLSIAKLAQLAQEGPPPPHQSARRNSQQLEVVGSIHILQAIHCSFLLFSFCLCFLPVH